MATGLDFAQRNVFVILMLAAAAAVHALLVRGAIIADAWYTVLGGRIVAHSGLPHHETLTVFGHGRDWVDQQWLAHLALYGLWAGGGWPLACLGIVALYAAAFALAAVAARLLGASERSASLLLLVCFVTGLPNTVLRAQVAAYPLFAIVLLLLLLDEQRPSRRVFLVFPVLMLWANVHGSVVLGAALVALRGATLAASSLRKRAPVGTWLPRASLLLLVPWACTLASPYALALPGYYHRTLANPAFSRLVSEWGPGTIRSQPLFFALLLVALWLVFRHGRGLGPFAQLALLCSAVAGLLAIRNIVWFALVAAAVLPSALDARWKPRQVPRHRRINLSLAGAAVLGLVVVAGVTASHGRGWFERNFPVQADNVVAAAAKADPKLRVFANERYADWLLFEHPALAGRVAYDVRFELFTSTQLQQLYDFATQSGPDWERAADGYGLLVLDPVSQGGIVSFYRGEMHAQTLYRDRHVVVLKLRTAPTR